MSVLQAYMQGRQARQKDDQVMRQNMMQQYMGENAQGIFQGDKQALSGLAAYDPQMALGIKSTNANMERQERADSRASTLFNQGQQDRTAALTAAQRAEAAAEIRGAVQRGLATTSPEEWDAMMAQSPETEQYVGQFDNRKQVAQSFLSLADQLESMQGPEPMSPAGKLKADLDAGLITQEQFAAAAQKSGLRVTTDAEGNVTLEQGPGVTGGPELGRSGQNALDNKEINSRDTLARLDRIENNFIENPELLDAQTMMGNIKRQGLEWKDYLGGDLTDEQAKYLVDVTAMRGDVLENANYTIQAITGAAMGVDEAKRIMATLPNIDDSPVVFKAKLERAMEATKMAVSRYNYWRSQGLGGAPEDVGTLSDMKRIMKDRANELIAEQAAAGLDPEEAKARAMQIFAEEFGIE